MNRLLPVTPNDIFALNATYPRYKVVGLDTTTHSTVQLTGNVKTSLGVTTVLIQ